MPVRRPTGPLVGLLAVLLLGLAGCGGAATLGPAIPAVGGAPREEQVAVPRVGQCRDLSAKEIQAVNNNSATVACDGDHNALTYYVGRLSGRPGRFPQTARELCGDRADEAIGLDVDDLAVTVISQAFFYPTAREYALGATAVRCDIMAADDSSSSAPPLPAGSRLPLFSDVAEVPDSLRRCRTAKGDNLPCTEAHVWRAESAFEATGGGRKRPSEDFFGRQARRQCVKTVETDRYFWTGPSISSWSDGDRTVTCFSRDVADATAGS